MFYQQFFFRRKNENDEISRLVYDFLKLQKPDKTLLKCDKDTSLVGHLVEEITLSHPILLRDAKFEDVNFFLYTVNNYDAEIETIETANGDNDDDIPASQHWILPNREFQGNYYNYCFLIICKVL